MVMPISSHVTKDHAMESLLKELPNGGAVVAIIVVVILFLREQTASRKDYLEHLRELTGIRMPNDKQPKR
jgi:hypothetical protein